MGEFASKGVAGSGLGLGIAGTALGVLNGMGGLLGGLGGCNGGYPYNWNHGGCCDAASVPVTRYEVQREQTIAAKDSEIALLKSNIYTDSKILAAVADVNARIRTLEDSVNANTCAQAVTNQKLSDNIAFTDSRIDSTKAEIIAYVNGTFVPGKLVMPLDKICPAAMPACPDKATK